jgi:hypothetical protein
MTIFISAQNLPRLAPKVTPGILTSPPPHPLVCRCSIPSRWLAIRLLHRYPWLLLCYYLVYTSLLLAAHIGIGPELMANGHLEYRRWRGARRNAGYSADFRPQCSILGKVKAKMAGTTRPNALDGWRLVRGRRLCLGSLATSTMKSAPYVLILSLACRLPGICWLAGGERHDRSLTFCCNLLFWLASCSLVTIT